MNVYITLTKKHQQEVNDFPFFFAFDKKQFNDGMRELGLNPTDTDKIYSLSGTGGYYRKSDSKMLHEMFDRHEKERQSAIDADTTGDGFIFDMFNYELGNHEYVVTYDETDAIYALGLSVEDVYSSKKLLHGLRKAKKAQLDWYAKHG